MPYPSLIANIAVSLMFAAWQASARTVYVRLADNSSRHVWPCGDDAASACATLSLALANATSAGSTRPPLTTAVLLPSRFNSVLEKEFLENISNVVIDANDTRLDLAKFIGLDVPWLEINNSSDVMISRLNASLVDFEGSAAVHVENCNNVTISVCTFTAPALNSRPLRVINSWPVRLLTSNFRGDQYHPALPVGAGPAYNLSAILVTFSCDPQNCQSGEWPMQGECCDSVAAQSTQQPSILIEGCTFYRLGIEPVMETYYRNKWEGAVTVHVEILSVKNVTSCIKSCNFSEIKSPFDSNVKIFLMGSTANSVTRVEDCFFTDSWLYIGGALLYRIEEHAEENQLIISRSTFSGNTAYIEGGAVAISFASGGTARRNTAVIEDSYFMQNKGSTLSGVGAVGGAVSAISASSYSQMSNRESMYPRLTLSNCTFTDNSATYGSAIFISGLFASVQSM